MHIMGIEPGSSAKVASALNHIAISPAPLPYFMRPETRQGWPVSLRRSPSSPPQHWNYKVHTTVPSFLKWVPGIKPGP